MATKRKSPRKRRPTRTLRGAPASGLRTVDDALDARLCGAAMSALIGYARRGSGMYGDAEFTRAMRGVAACYAKRPCPPGLAGARRAKRSGGLQSAAVDGDELLRKYREQAKLRFSRSYRPGDTSGTAALVYLDEAASAFLAAGDHAGWRRAKQERDRYDAAMIARARNDRRKRKYR